MAAVTPEKAEEIRLVLHDAAVQCSERCLYQSAKWLAELSNSLSPISHSDSDPDPDLDSPMQDAEQPTPSIPSVQPRRFSPREIRLEARERSKYLLAKSYFDCREYDRCAAVFLPSNISREPLSATSPNVTTRAPPKENKGKAKESGSAVTPNTLPQLSQKSLFLALYAKYLSGEKRKDEDSEMVLGPLDGGPTVNKELVGIGRSLDVWFADRTAKGLESENQGWLEYLYGVVLVKGKSEKAGKNWLVLSLKRCPWNWGAWLELSDLLGSVEELHQLTTPELLPTELITHIFFIYTKQQLYQKDETTTKNLDHLQRIFPGSLFLKTQRALLYYHAKDFEKAESTFSAILHADPHRIDSLDHYSNILYVMGARPKLAFLAQLATATDKFRPETCCVVGNYYSLKSEHEKAVMYFRRALTLDRSFLSAWTLMGHEYIELKNTHAAIESYRHAVDINRKDYRAWYGLGQTYEVLELHLYALFYYQRAASLHPYDPQMWQAVGSCYDKIDRPLQSIKAFKRALVAGTYHDAGASFGSGTSRRDLLSGTLDPEMLYQIALMHEKMNDTDEAAAYMEMTLTQEYGNTSPNNDNNSDNNDNDDSDSRGPGTGVTNTTAKARMWLARWEFARGGLQRAMQLASEHCENGVEVEEAKALIRDIRARMEISLPLKYPESDAKRVFTCTYFGKNQNPTREFMVRQPKTIESGFLDFFDFSPGPGECGEGADYDDDDDDENENENRGKFPVSTSKRAIRSRDLACHTVHIHSRPVNPSGSFFFLSLGVLLPEFHALSTYLSTYLPLEIPQDPDPKRTLFSGGEERGRLDKPIKSASWTPSGAEPEPRTHNSLIHSLSTPRLSSSFTRHPTSDILARQYFGGEHWVVGGWLVGLGSGVGARGVGVGLGGGGDGDGDDGGREGEREMHYQGGGV